MVSTHVAHESIPIDFARTIVELYGAAGLDWLRQLPATIADCEQRWSLTVMPPFAGLSYNYVAPAIRADGTAVVLKVGVPNPELTTEIEALRLYNGRGIVRLLDADPEEGMLLLERLRPGAPLSSLADDQAATSIAAGVMRQLWRPVPADHPFPTVAKWAAGLARLRDHFGGRTGPFPTRLVEAAETLFRELIDPMGESVLLHGDLHHDNVLAAQRQPWLALDPKGVVGEPAYEVGALLRNPLPQLLTGPQPARVLARRVDQLAEELGFDGDRIVGWGLAQAVLSAWWSVEDHRHGWEPAIACAELLATLMTQNRTSVRQGLLTAAAQGIGRETSPNIGECFHRSRQPADRQHTMITSLTIAQPVAGWLQTEPRCLRVHSAFPGAINLVGDDGQFLTLLPQNADTGPFALRLAGRHLPDLPVGSLVVANHGIVAAGPLLIDWQSATRWDPNLKPLQKPPGSPVHVVGCLDGHDSMLARALPALFPLLPPPKAGESDRMKTLPLPPQDGGGLGGDGMGVDPTAFHTQVAAQAAGHLATLLAGLNGDDTALADAVRALLGFGEGLTPAGDDCLLGVLAARRMSGQPAGVLEKLIPGAASRTTSLSAAFLRAAGRGQFAGHWHRLRDALEDGQPADVQQALRHILALGATSGADAVAGWVVGYLHHSDLRLPARPSRGSR